MVETEVFYLHDRFYAFSALLFALCVQFKLNSASQCILQGIASTLACINSFDLQEKYVISYANPSAMLL